MKKVFIDCGYHLGEGLKEFTSTLKIDSEWDVYAFEANPYCNIETKISQHPFKVNAYNKAVWISNSKAMFNCQNQQSTNSPTEGSTHELDGWGSCLTSINSRHEYETQEEIETIDFSEFLSRFKGCEVYVKMDIEGAEFEILRKCISDDTYSIINSLWVEWHDVDLEFESNETIADIIGKLNGININNWK
jgi:FkbM family methyltransferase